MLWLLGIGVALVAGILIGVGMNPVWLACNDPGRKQEGGWGLMDPVDIQHSAMSDALHCLERAKDLLDSYNGSDELAVNEAFETIQGNIQKYLNKPHSVTLWVQLFTDLRKDLAVAELENMMLPEHARQIVDTLDAIDGVRITLPMRYRRSTAVGIRRDLECCGIKVDIKEVEA